MTIKKEPAAFLPTVTGNPDSFTGSDESITDVKKNTSSAETNGRKEMANEKTPWCYCVVGNIVKSRIDENGLKRHGTVAFTGGTKVYLCDKQCNKSYEKIPVIGLNRHKKYVTEYIPVTAIENVRCSKVYKQQILKLIDYYYLEYEDCYWENTPKDKAETEDFVQHWNTTPY